MIIDCHTHWGMVWEDKYGTEPAEWLRIPDSHGVSASLLMGHRGLCAHSDVGRANDIVAETCLKSGENCSPWHRSIQRPASSRCLNWSVASALWACGA